MYRMSNHWGQLGKANWSLSGPDDYVADPFSFHMFQPGNMKTGFIKYGDLHFNF